MEGEINVIKLYGLDLDIVRWAKSNVVPFVDQREHDDFGEIRG